MRFALLICLFLLPPALLAQDDSEEEGILLPEFIVYSGSEDGRNVETDAIYGFPIDWLEAPRSVTSFSTAAFDSGAFVSVRDFSKLFSSGYSKTNFGSPAHPSIRGLPADILVDGMRQGLRSFGNGMPFSFNAYDAVHVVKGIPNPAFGIQQYVSGYVNLERKMPTFGPFSGKISTQYGSYDTKVYQLEFQDILTDNLAYLFSTEIENSGSYYENGFQNTEAFYFAIASLPDSSYHFDLSVDYFHADYTENFGINRPTQALIDRGLYQTGSVVDTNGDGARNNRDINGAFNEIELGPQKPIDRSKRLLGRGDHGEGQHLNVQLRQQLEINDNWKLENSSLFRWVDRKLRSSYFYSEIIDDSYAFENRFSSDYRHASPFHEDRDAQLFSGLTLRYQHVRAINDYFNEPANAWDLLSSQRINYVNQAANGSTAIAGHPGFFGSPGQFNGETNDSEAYTFAPFLHWRLPLTERTTFDIGSRLDILDVEFQDPLGSFEDSYTAYLPSFTTSLSQSLTSNLQAYVSYAYGESTGIANGGGYSVSPDGFTDDYFGRENFLYEVGLKSRIGDRGTVSLAAFNQQRNEGLLGDRTDEFSTTGIELEVFAAATDRLDFMFTYAWLDSFLEDQSPFVISGSPVDSTAFDGTPGNVTPTFTTLPKGDYREPGLPQHLINLGVSYQVFDEWTVSGAFNYTSKMNNNYSGTLEIPAQHWIDLTLTYNHHPWSWWFTIANLTDQENWSPPNPIFGNDSIVADLPIHFRTGISLKF